MRNKIKIIKANLIDFSVSLNNRHVIYMCSKGFFISFPTKKKNRHTNSKRTVTHTRIPNSSNKQYKLNETETQNFGSRTRNGINRTRT